MTDTPALSCTAFVGPRRIATGSLDQVAQKAKALLDADASTQILIFDDTTSRPLEVDWRGTLADVLMRLAPAPTEAARRGPGRPRLGVTAREVTLLPRHWDWLSTQPGGASVALRKLVEAARRANAGKDQLRQAQEATYRFMHAMAGDLPGFEEAARALFANDKGRFTALAQPWPADVRDHLHKLADMAFQG